jgi:hypothetical protein|tara:strand:+ start:514 stop:696 length:183 start_codon:yes stop_codon:yes gene_type:complete
MKDKCVTCDVDSIYDFDEHIKFRIGYIKGVGQLCLDCYDKILKGVNIIQPNFAKFFNFAK